MIPKKCASPNPENLSHQTAEISKEVPQEIAEDISQIQGTTRRWMDLHDSSLVAILCGNPNSERFERIRNNCNSVQGRKAADAIRDPENADIEGLVTIEWIKKIYNINKSE